IMNFGERLKKIRMERGLRQEDIGKIVHVGKSAVSQWENNIHVPDLETVTKIANALNIPVDYLLGRIDNPSTPSWWYRDTPPTDVELEEFLKTANIYFDGAPLNEEDKEDIVTYLKVKWEREKKKREKEGKK
ncbi:MAG: helix-turn-helix domain-containing protein, partial [Peptococcaceae bacterium]|nr:helix-turn-helix domain-containing protein [Peptococcaceae bacterium]